MNEAHASVSSNDCGPLGLLLVIVLCCWCWLGHGPRVLGWPLVVLLVLMTSGHWAGDIVSASMEVLAEPVLALLIMIGGLLIILRGFGLRRRRTYRPDYREGWWRNDRW